MNFVKSCNKKKTTTLSNNKTLTAGPAAEEGLGMGHVIHYHHRHITTYLSRKINKKINRKQMKKKRVSKQKLSKGCHQCQNVTVLDFLERLKFKNFYCRPTMVAVLFMVPPL